MTAVEGRQDEVVEPDPYEARVARSACGLLRLFNDAGALTAADVHVAMRLGRFLAEDDEQALPAAAFAVRAPRLGHVCADVATIRDTVTVDSDTPVDLQGLAWPDLEEWLEALAGSPLVAIGIDGPDNRPLRLVGTRLYRPCTACSDAATAARPGSVTTAETASPTRSS